MSQWIFYVNVVFIQQALQMHQYCNLITCVKWCNLTVSVKHQNSIYIYILICYLYNYVICYIYICTYV